MTAEFILVATIIGLLAGWLADVVMEGGGYGVVGGVWTFRALGFAPKLRTASWCCAVPAIRRSGTADRAVGCGNCLTGITARSYSRYSDSIWSIAGPLTSTRMPWHVRVTS